MSFIINPYAFGAAPFSPTDIANLELWLKADAGVTLSGSDVSQWADQSGNAHDFTSPTSSERPTYTASGLNGLPIINFNGSTDYLLNATGLNSAVLGNDFTIFIVNRVTSNTNARFLDLTTSATNSLQLIRDSTTTKHGVRVIYSSVNIVDQRVYTVMDLNQWKTFEYHSDGSFELFVNGANQADSGTVAIGIAGTGSYIGRRADGNSSTYLAGNIAEILIYTRALTTDERTDVRDYLQTKYAHY